MQSFQGGRPDHRRLRVRVLALPRHPQHREPLLNRAAAEDGRNIQGNFELK